MLELRSAALALNVPFASSGSKVTKKQFLFLTEAAAGGAWWELTYSPSLGSNYQGLVDAIRSFESCRNTNPVLRAHLEWIDALRRQAHSRNGQERWSITQFDLQALESTRWVDSFTSCEWLRLKVHGELSLSTVSLLQTASARTKCGLILDFNGSATANGVYQAARLTDSFRRVYVEQPYRSLDDLSRTPSADGLLRIFDAPDSQVLALLGGIRQGEVVVSKLGRNSPGTLARVEEAGAWTSFGNVISTRIGDATLDEAAKLGSLDMTLMSGSAPSVDGEFIGLPQTSARGLVFLASGADEALRARSSMHGTIPADWDSIAPAGS